MISYQGSWNRYLDMPDTGEDSLSSLYRTLIENARDVITLLDEQGVIKFISPSVEIQFGYTPDELLGINIFELIHEDDVAIAIDALQKVAAGIDGVPPTLVQFRHKDQSWRYGEVVGQVSAGELPGIILVTREITERHKTLLTLRESEESFEAAFNATNSLCTISVAETGEFINVNDSWVKSLEWTRQEAIGKTAGELNI